MAITVKGLINTSLDDCKISLGYVADLPLLRELLAECEQLGMQARAQVVGRRIKQLRR